MPVCGDRDWLEADLSPSGASRRGRSPTAFRESDPTSLQVGLINNMPDAALEATERQFLTLLDAAADGMVVRVLFYALPDIPRSESGQCHMRKFYSGIDDLWHGHLDGLIVTGTEPRASNLKDEAYWGSLTAVLEWAEHNTHSAIWSCLAAQAAVLHFDGIVRRPLRDKRFGIFDCLRVNDHHLTEGVPARLPIPHSRWNDIPEEPLTACGYRVLTRSAHAGVDAFVKQRQSLFVFFQGHPEYEAHTLLLEYRRDIKRFLRAERDTYPPMPRSYFGPDTVAALTALRERAMTDRREQLLDEFATTMVADGVKNTWRAAAARLYRNWLLYLFAQKRRPRQPR
jgi:homoserine O-succinyltransferase/O-acetyltransferase